MPHFIEFEHHAHVAVMRLNRPSVRNAISNALRDELLALLDVVALDPEIRAVIIRGAGRNFSSGADLREFGEATSVHSARAARRTHSVYRRVLLLDKPSVALLEGAAAGGGLELALSCDVRIATRDARVSLPELFRGFIPGGGGTQLISRRAGIRPPTHMLYLGGGLDAEKARFHGLVHEIYDTRHAAEARALTLASELATLDPTAVADLKRLLINAS